jgi:predicted RNA binding protein YcfA (HicA-like mRNA interferase family)
MKVREVIRLLESNEWVCVRTKGSHRQFKHTSNPDVVTVAGKPNTDVPTGTLHAILKKAGIERTK